ncbi:hypothetical protein MicloDRAFT_00060810 [Microvirga lotononidis]|uniref:Uncharacterized protein n=1 Tax=Microvirga lotononidis TaxID=864069 RepID=I4YN13_9HYPH|nr:hypothetical protein MicloDRAFT_00060810 [Microvirga lotononidis]
METLLVLTYAAICYAAFRIFRVPANKWTVPTAFIGGVILVGLILLGMNYNVADAELAELRVPVGHEPSADGTGDSLTYCGSPTRGGSAAPGKVSLPWTGAS